MPIESIPRVHYLWAQDAALGLWALHQLHLKHAPPGVTFIEFATSFANVTKLSHLHLALGKAGGEASRFRV